MKIGLIYGSDTGETEEAALKIEEKFNQYNLTKHNVANINEKIILKYDFLIFGLSTWYDGDMQSDWETYFDEFKQIDFSGKIVAIFGLGDQYGYDYNFVDGIGIIAKQVLLKNGQIIGDWPTKGYEFEESKAIKNNETFFGLALDEDNQYEMTEERIEKWTTQIMNHKIFREKFNHTKNM